jgi:hypothetical protein
MQTLPAFVASRRLGQATVTIISEGSFVVFTHARFPAWGHIRPAGAGYRWERA